MTATVIFLTILAGAALATLIAHQNNKIRIHVTPKDGLRGLLLLGTLFLSDVWQNKILDKGTGYASTFVDTIKIPALTGWYITLLIITAIFLWYAYDAIQRPTPLFTDITMIFVGVLSIVFLVSATWMMTVKPASTIMLVIGSNLITIYHLLGIAPLCTSILYLTLTEPRRK